MNVPELPYLRPRPCRGLYIATGRREETRGRFQQMRHAKKEFAEHVHAHHSDAEQARWVTAESVDVQCNARTSSARGDWKGARKMQATQARRFRSSGRRGQMTVSAASSNATMSSKVGER